MCLWLSGRHLFAIGFHFYLPFNPAIAFHKHNQSHTIVDLRFLFHYQHPMSSFTILGFFALANGHHMQTQKPGTSAHTWHAHYATTIQCITPLYVPADLRIYSPINDVLHPDNTIAFVVARVHIPCTEDILLDAIHIVPCPGNPLDDSYNDSVPYFQFSMVYRLGVVSSPHESLPNRSMAFSVALTEYVHDANQQSTVQCIISYYGFKWWLTIASGASWTGLYLAGGIHQCLVLTLLFTFMASVRDFPQTACLVSKSRELLWMLARLHRLLVAHLMMMAPHPKNADFKVVPLLVMPLHQVPLPNSYILPCGFFVLNIVQYLHFSYIM